jgi:hypothetical protein
MGHPAVGGRDKGVYQDLPIPPPKPGAAFKPALLDWRFHSCRH